MAEKALIDQRLKELVLYVERVNRQLPPGLVDSVSARATAEENDDGGTDYEFTVTTQPFSEFAEVTADTVSFTVDQSRITQIFFEEGWESRDHVNLELNAGNVERLIEEIRDWVGRVTPK